MPKTVWCMQHTKCKHGKVYCQCWCWPYSAQCWKDILFEDELDTWQQNFYKARDLEMEQQRSRSKGRSKNSRKGKAISGKSLSKSCKATTICISDEHQQQTNKTPSISTHRNSTRKRLRTPTPPKCVTEVRSRKSSSSILYEKEEQNSECNKLESQKNPMILKQPPRYIYQIL